MPSLGDVVLPLKLNTIVEELVELPFVISCPLLSLAETIFTLAVGIWDKYSVSPGCNNRNLFCVDMPMALELFDGAVIRVVMGSKISLLPVSNNVDAVIPSFVWYIT